MKPIHQTYKIKASVEKVWNAFINPATIDKWGGGPAVMSDKKGSKFNLWGKEIWGTNLEVIPLKKLKQEWYSTDSPKHPTSVTFNFTSNGTTTKVELIHENVEVEHYKSISDGWHSYYLGPLKKFLEKN